MKTFIRAGLLCIISFSTANAAVVGYFDSSRTYSAYQLNGSYYTEFNSAVASDGHSTAGTGTITSSFLSSVDVFFTGILDTDSSGILTSGEVAALTNWVSNGGILFSVGENNSFQQQYDTLLNPFGIFGGGNSVSGGTWVNDPSIELLQNGVAGNSINFVAGQSVTTFSGTFDVLATGGGLNLAVSKQFGSGLVVAVGDGNFIDDQYGSAVNTQFGLNVINANVVPVPAAVWLFGSALAGLGWLRRKQTVS